jgi:hypothetical protein
MEMLLMSHDRQSVEELRQRSEIVRAELAGTVGELRDKVSDTASEIKTLVSPSHIKQEIKTYIREERESLQQSLQRRIKENPLQAAAVGAAIAYPAWGVLRAIPTPLLLIGAGLWLTTSKGRQSAQQIGAAATDAAQQATARASELAGEIGGNIVERAEAVSRTLSEAGEAVSSRAGEVTQQARMAAHDLRDAVAARSTGAASAATDAADAASGRIAQTFAQTRDNVAGAAQKSQSAVMDFVDKNPLLVAGIGAAVGAFIAASLPPSQAENKLFGDRADDLKDKALGAAAQGLDKARTVAADVADDVAAAAARQGLDGAGLQNAAETVTQGMKSVAERGMRTAFGEKSSEIQPSQQNELQGARR